MKKSQSLAAIFAHLMPALIALSSTVFADESVNEHQRIQGAVNTSTNHWTIPSITRQWIIPTSTKQWTIPSITRQWTIPPSTKQWTIPSITKQWSIPE
jgi:hypothetical protein